MGRQGRVDGSPKTGGVPRTRHEIEVERRVELVWPEIVREALGIREPDLPDEDPVAGIGLGDRPPIPVDLVEAVAVGVRVVAGARSLGNLRQRRILHEQGGRVDAHTGNAAIEPEAEDLFVFGPDLRVVPVEIRLLGREQVQVPIARRAIGIDRPGPRLAPEVGGPGRRWNVAGGAATRVEPEPPALWRAGSGGQCGLEPWVLVGDVVGNDVDDRPDAKLAGFVDQGLRLGERPERRIDRPVVRHVVPTVRKRRDVPGREPDGIDTEVAQVWKA